MKGLSVRAPWWWFILYGGKTIENRGLRFPRSVRGRVWLHVGKWWDEEEVFYDTDDALAMQEEARGSTAEPKTGWESLRASCGCIVGSVEIIDYVTESDSPWFVGELGLVLRNPIALATPVPFKGMLGFFEVPDGTVNE